MPRSMTSKDNAARNSSGESESAGRGREEQPLLAGPNDTENIARRAYERFEMRGGEHGHHEEDWLEAERELNVPDSGKNAS